MVKVKLKELFKFSPNGRDVQEFEPGEHELSIRGAECALEAEVVCLLYTSPSPRDRG